MNGAHLASPIRGELAWLCSLAPAGNPIYCPFGHQIWGPSGKQDLCPNFALTAAKFLLSNSGNFRAKAIPPSPGLGLKAHSGNEWGQIPVLTGLGSNSLLQEEQPPLCVLISGLESKDE